MRILTILMTVSALAMPASAQIQVEKRRAAPPDGDLYIENTFGSITVRGWDRNEVLVTGTLAAGAQDLEIDSDEDGVYIEVDVPESWFYLSDDDTEYRSHLTVQVPRSYGVWAETVNADIDIEGVGGEIDLETINGGIRVVGPVQSVEVETLTGSVVVHAEAAPMEIETISGSVELRGVRKYVEVETVSGNVNITGSAVEELGVESTSGNVVFRGSLAQHGDLEIETFSGAVHLTLPADVRGSFEMRTFSGGISSALGPRSSHGERFLPFDERRFSTGSEGFEVEIQTHSGAIKIEVAEPGSLP